MTTTLDAWLPASIARRPKGMTWDDWSPWRKYMTTDEARTYQFVYDVELRVDIAPATETDEKIRNMWERNNARRIDAVGLRGDDVTIFEARRIVGPSALGQIRTYAGLWPMFFPTRNIERLVIVTDRIPDELRAIARIDKIDVWSAEDLESGG